MTQRKQPRPQPKSRQRNGYVHVPDDIVHSILLRLPVKSLRKFRCVCKSWYSSITSTNFISTHLNTSNNKDHGYMVHMDTVFRKPPVCTVVCDRTYSMISKYPISFTFHSCHAEIVGSCNGLLCLFENRRGRNWGNVITLWNPSIRKFKRLPDSSLSGKYDQVSNGFGYQSETNDYKVVKIYSYPTGDIMQNRIVAEVYTLSSDSWREVGISLRPKVAVSSIETYSSATFVSGALHWLGYFNTEFKDLQSEKRILSFDCWLFKGKLAFITIGYYNILVLDVPCFIWVMGEYGVHESWKKLFSLRLGHFENFFGFTRHGDLIIQKNVEVPFVNFKVVSVNSETLHEMDLVTHHLPSIAITFVESLVLRD
ncbi:hypothetical protein ACB092_11G162000 [Castanea dentata]